jgi:glycosyltransferase involved in cell wall biosynthesis
MYHNIRILAKTHSVRVISFVDSDAEHDLLRTLDGLCESVTAVRRVPDFRPHWLSLDPFLAREFQTPEMSRAVDRAFREQHVDVLQCEYLQMAQYRRRHAFSILTIHETLSANAYEAFQSATEPVEKLRLYYRWMQLLRYEVLATRQFDRIVTMTEHDARYLRSYSASIDVRPIPIGVDLSEFQPMPEDLSSPIEIVFVGNFRHTPNIQAVQFLAEKIAPQFPDVTFLIPGDNLPVPLRQSPRNVIFPGYVADTRVLYRRPNTIVAAPLFSGTGQRVKLLEGFSMACPVITTSIGALGFPVADGTEALIANSADGFCSALRRLISSVDLRRRLGCNARRMIERYFDWEFIGQDILSLIEEAR